MAGLQFVGVPALPVPDRVRQAIERAWFEQAPLRLRYRGSNGVVTSRTFRIQGVVFERSITMINGIDLDKNEPRQLRLDRIESALVVLDPVQPA
jgi:predicted DNA-binding transcriptional regulator YafY